VNEDSSQLPKRLQQFQDLSLKLISLAEKGRVISDYYEDVSKLLIDFSGAEYISIIARGAHSYFRFCYSGHQGWEMSQLDDFPNPDIKNSAAQCFSGLSSGKCSLDRLEELVFSGSAEKSDLVTGSGGLKITIDSPADKSTLYRSLLVLPVRNQTERIGTITLGWQGILAIDTMETELYQYLFDIIGFSRSHRQAKFLLAERIKELKTIYQINRIGSEPGKSLEDIMLGSVEIIPPGFLHPDFTCCKIVYANHTFKSSNYQKPVYTLKEDILAGDEVRGYVEVGYMRESGSIYKDPFLKEEQPMLKAIAGELGHVAARKQHETEKERLMQQLLHADRLVTVGQLTAGIAHELNEPLGGILGFAQLIKKYGQIDEQVEKDIDKIIKASLHGREIIRKLMLFSRQTPPEKVMVNINEKIDDGLYLLENRMNKSNIKLIKDYTANLPLIEIDPAQLNQVLVNLVVNAIQAMPGGGELTIKTTSTIDEILIIIKDTGTGIEADKLESIFIPFYTTKGPNEGAGLGLPVALGIVQSHRGTITVDSKPGAGTAFTVSFPIGGEISNAKAEEK
jgi:two-component system, NtrC family, sensor kinase